MTRDGFIFYSSYFLAAKDMPPKDRLSFYDALIGYALDGSEPEEMTKLGNIAFTLCRPQIDANNRRYENGKRGGRPKKTDGFENEKPMVLKNDAGKITETKPKYKEKEKEKEYRKEIDKEKKEPVAAAPALPRFVKPSLEEVSSYADRMRYAGFNAARFYAFYESNGWKVGRNPMRSWKNAVTSWHFRDQETSQPVKRPTYNDLHPIGDFTHERTTI